MQLAELYEQCEVRASRIPGFVKGKKEDVAYDIDKIANGYCQACDAGDETLKDSYASAYFIRYWHMIFYYKNKSEGVDVETILEWLIDGFIKACKYRSWLKDKKLINNVRGAEICINNAIDTMRKNFYKHSNAKKRKDLFFSDNIVNLDDLTEREAEYYLGYDEGISDKLFELSIVNSMLEKRRYLDSVMIDLIINGDSVSHDRFSVVKLNREAKNLDDSYYDYFIRKYNVDSPESLKKETSHLTTWKLNKALERLRNSPEIICLSQQ